MELKGPTVGSYSVILARSLLMPGVTLGKHVVVSANSKVSRSFEDWAMVKGDPAEKVCDSRQFFYTDGDRVFRPYPWMLHRRAGFPWEKNIPPEWEVGTRAPGTEGP
jgi:serine acetyltransferase